ncbi:hypothetical protein SELMODRAFT_448088 [Selaginella moellendorffii]|uniref:Uncharacterized protein n=1 Tax=Selaginella moellendorffii TaxID=88036 RepID=D8T4Q7_SELML|nr:uncharacterized protein LOC9662461 [Selaginella moellendorffii]EFJ08463.1 hypothetical protein SELMODRAFT_448088 [Selaginella moellendorffii]|eukprot:XP_024520102.1 uncharacterized protein LOC9662461 [Selaginella moellendorffii]
MTRRCELIFKMVDGRLVIRRPCMFSFSQLVSELLAYSRRNRCCSCDYCVSSSFTWFRCSDGQLLGPEIAISEKRSFDTSSESAMSSGKMALEGVGILVLIQFYESEEDAKRGVTWQAELTKAATFGFVVPGSVVLVAYLDHEQGAVKMDRLEAPRFLDMTAYSPRLSGMRFYPAHFLGSLWADPLHDPALLVAQTDELRTRLVESISEGRTQVAYEIVVLLDSLDFVDPVHGNTPLLAALQYQAPDLDLVKFLVDNGANATGRARSGVWPYLYAVVNGMQAVMDALDDNGNSQTHLNSLAPKELCETENPELLEMLLRLGLSPNKAYEGILPLNNALSGRNCMERLQLLLKAGADPTLQDGQGNCALGLVVDDQPPEIVRLVARVCQERSVIDTKVDPVNTALGVACLFDEPVTCSVLMECGASPFGTYCYPPHDLQTGLKMLFALTDTPLPDCLK